MKTILISIFCVLSALNFLMAQPKLNDDHSHHKHVHGKTKSSLLENKGQWPAPVLFQSSIEGGKVWIQQNKFVYHLQDYAAMHDNHGNFDSDAGFEIKEKLVHLNFVGSNQISAIEKNDESSFYFNYFKGNDRSKWASNVHSYGYAVLKNLYDGIDLNVQNQGGQFKYEFIISPFQSHQIIQLNYAGQESLKINEAGDLEITTSLGKIFEEHPYAYQLIDGQEVEVDCGFVLVGENISFQLGKYDKSKTLIIDPVLIFATYNAAFSDNFGMTATYGYDGSAYAGGMVYGNNYPMPSGTAYDINSNFTVLNGAYGVTDVFITKFSPDGTNMLWSTFLGGGNNNAGTEAAHSLICDLNDNIYVFGSTSSADFPTSAGAYDATHNGGTAAQLQFNGVTHDNQGVDLYVSKFSADGTTLMGSTFVGGSGNDGMNYEAALLPYDNVGAYTGIVSNYGDQFRGEITLDASNNVVVASCTKSTNFPTVNAFQNSNAGNQDGVIFMLSSDFTQLLFSSYYGGSQDDACYSVKTDLSGNFVFAGGTESTNIPGTAGGLQPNSGGGSTDGFVVKVPSGGNSIVNASYIGMNQYDQVFFVEIDRVNNIFLLGQSVGGNFPINNASYSNGSSSNFVIKLDSLLSTNLASTRFGNGSSDIQISPAAFLVDNCGNIYVSGWGANILQANTQLNGMPVTVDALQAAPAGGADFYLMVMKADMSNILYGSYIGGPVSDEHVDGGTSRFDKNGIVYQCVCAGCGGSDDFPTSVGAYSAVNNSSNCNAVVYKFDSGLLPLAEFTVDQTIGCNDFTVTFDNTSSSNDTYLWDFGDGELDSTTFNPVITYTDAGIYEVNLYVTDSICQLTDTAQIIVTVVDSVLAEVIDPISVCNNDPIDISVNSYGTANTFIWSENSNFSNPLNAPTDSVITVTTSGIYYIQVDNGFCTAQDTVNVLFEAPPEAEFQLLDTIGCAPLTVGFDNLSVQTSYFLWDFGNGNVDSTTFEPVIEYTTPGQYQVSLYIFDSICPVSDTAFANVTIVPDVTIESLDSLYICNQPNTTLVANSNGTANSFTWSDVSDFSNVLNPTNDSTIVVTNVGTYYVQLTNGYCTINDSVFVDFSDEPIADFTLDNTQGCAPVNVNFTNNSLPDSDFLWDFGNGVVDSLNFDPTFTYNAAGTYFAFLYVYDDFCGVFAADSAQIIVTPEPTIDLVDTVELCVPTPTTLSPSTSGSTQFIWSTNNLFTDTLNNILSDPNVIIDNPTEGYYYIEASNSDCSIIDSVVFIFIEPELSINAQDSICVGDVVDITVTNLNPSISLDYEWEPNTALINPGNTETVQGNPLFSQYISVTGTSPEGCIVEDSIFINVSDIDSTLVIASASQYAVAQGGTVTLFGSPSGLSSYQWTPETGLNAPTNQQTDAVIEEDIIFTLTVSDGICSREDTVEIKIYENICEGQTVFLPNAFSPNGDMNNDVLYVRGIDIEKMIFRIFDRWGEMVFESTNIDNGWDGTFWGVQLQPDVYDYYLDVTCVGGLNSIVKGNVTLMR